MSENILLVWAMLLFVAVVAGKVAYRFGDQRRVLFGHEVLVGVCISRGSDVGGLAADR